MKSISLRPKLRPLASAAVLACASFGALALDLSQAYQAALEQDATIRASRAATDARRERVPQARSQLLPNLSATVTRFNNTLQTTAPNIFGEETTTNDRYVSSNQTLTLRQPLYRPYQVADLRKAAADVADANAQYERDLQNVAVRVAGAYFEALLTEDALALNEAQRKAYTTQLDSARKRFAAGSGTRTDIDEAQAALDLNVAQGLEARQNQDYTRRQLAILVNQPVTSLAKLDIARLKLVDPNPGRVEDWIELAERNSPEVASGAAQLEAARYEVDKAKAGHLPTLDAIAQISRSDSDNVTRINSRYDQKSVGVQLSVPIFSGGYVNSQVRQALADQERAAQALEATKRDLDVRVHQQFRGVTEGVLKVRALEQAVKSAELSVQSNRRSFDAGARTLVDTLNAEQQKTSALRDLSQARLIYLISRIRLQALAGGPKSELIEEINGMLEH